MIGPLHALPAEDGILDTVEALSRRQAYIASMGMSVGFLWNQLSVETRDAVMDMVNGGPGLHEKIVEWAGEFDVMYEERQRIAMFKSNDPLMPDFHNEIATFTDAKIKTLMVEARLTQ